MRIKRTDRKNAQSIINAAERDMDYTMTLSISEESGPTIIRNIYECFRMLGDALLLSKGIESIDHLMPIKELMNLKISSDRPLNVLDNLRRLRHNINYYGYKPNVFDVEDAVSISKSLFPDLIEEVRKRITPHT